jgi:hypothetical protein
VIDWRCGFRSGLKRGATAPVLEIDNVLTGLFFDLGVIDLIGTVVAKIEADSFWRARL